MVNVTYNIPELGPPAIHSVRLGVLLLTALALPFIFPLIFRKTLEDKHGHRIPPGPPIRYPFLRRHPERALRAWSRTYGPLFSLDGQPTLCCDFGCAHCQGLVGLQQRNLFQS
jgi:hypothetical protein